MEHVHRIVYINLDRRTDRRQQLEQELQRLEVPTAKVERFAAIAHAEGLIGCGLSHLAVIRRAREQQWPNVLVLEDDFCAKADHAQLQAQLADLFRLPGFDVFMLAYNIPDQQEDAATAGIVPTQNAQTTSAYLVHSDIYDRLIETWEDGLALLQSEPWRHWDFALDQYWKRLQPESRWFRAVPRLGFQRASFSDCSQQFMDHGV